MRNEKERREAALWRVMRYFGFFTDRSVKRGGSEFTRGAAGIVAAAVAFAAAVVSMAVLLPSGRAVENMEEVDQTEAERIEVPALETDDFLWEQPAPRFSSPADDASSETRESDTIAESTTETEAETTVQETTAQETVSPETVSPETTAPETTAPETSAPETTKAPEPAREPEKLLADEMKVAYKIDKDAVTEATDYEIKLVATVIQLEVMGDGSELEAFEDTSEKYTEMLGVAQCIRNRVRSVRFPSTIKDVVLQPNQFSPASKLDMYEPTDAAVTAAREVMLKGVTVFADNYYYFCATMVSSTFEAQNETCLTKTQSGTYDKWTGHLTTFYAGRR
ncbi:MAG: cell wall hydrolase [Candidatus Flemingibacterium sp.]|nr:cell wall hydrolase [Candidatus Flemingibacterium sp.]